MLNLLSTMGIIAHNAAVVNSFFEIFQKESDFFAAHAVDRHYAVNTNTNGATICPHRKPSVRRYVPPLKNSARRYHPHRTAFTAHQSATNGAKNKKAPAMQVLFCGGKSGIRTHGALLTHTRFPIVRLRPAQPSFHDGDYYTISERACQYILQKNSETN